MDRQWIVFERRTERTVATARILIHLGWYTYERRRSSCYREIEHDSSSYDRRRRWSPFPLDFKDRNDPFDCPRPYSFFLSWHLKVYPRELNDKRFTVPSERKIKSWGEGSLLILGDETSVHESSGRDDVNAERGDPWTPKSARRLSRVPVPLGHAELNLHNSNYLV